MQLVYDGGKFPDNYTMIGGFIDLGKDEVDIQYIHGWLLWAVWAPLGLIQFFTGRYLVVYPRIKYWVHLISGLSIGIVTLVMSLLVFKYYEWELRDDRHDKIGFATLIIVGFIILSGLTSSTLMFTLNWKTNKIQYFKFVHRWTSYGILILA